MNLKSNGILQTINFHNIVNQLNDVTEILEGSSNGDTISEIQLKNLNNNIEKVKNKLELLELDVNKYIDETELTEALKDIKLSLKNIVKSNDLNNAINNLTTSISTLIGRIETLENREIINTSEFVKNNELNTKVENSIKSNIDKIENKFLENSKETIKNNINDKVTELVGNIDNKINDKVEEKLNLEISNINNSINEKTNDKITENTLNTKLYNYAKLNKDNEFTNNNTFRKVVVTELKSSSLNSNEYKLNDIKFIDNDNTFSIGITDKDINLISKGKLLLNGVEFKSKNEDILTTEKLNEITTGINNNKVKITEVENKFSDYLKTTDFTTNLQNVNSRLNSLDNTASNLNTNITQNVNRYNSLLSSVSTLNSNYNSLSSNYTRLSNIINNLGNNYTSQYVFNSFKSDIENKMIKFPKIDEENNYTGRNDFKNNKLYVDNIVVRPVKTIFEGKMNILRNYNGGNTRIERFNYSSYVSGYEYNCIMFYVCDDNMYNVNSGRFSSWNGGLRGIVDTYLMPKNSVYVSNQYVENDITKSFRVMVDDYNKVILGFYNGIDYSMNITKIVIF